MWYRELVGAVSFTVPGKVAAKGRPRFTRGGGVYTPRATAEAEQRVRRAYNAQARGAWATFAGPVKVSIITYRPLAKSNPKRWAGRADTGKPDADNVAKLVLDALKGVAWRDDAQVVDLHVVKSRRTPHGERGGTDVRVLYYEDRFDGKED